MSFRITYSVLNADMSALHREFDAALHKLRASLEATYPSWIAGQPYRSGTLIENRNPADTRQLLGYFAVTPPAELDRALDAARAAQVSWNGMGYEARVKLMNRAADLISERRMLFAAAMVLETGKNRLEALGDVEEAADLLRYYAGQIQEAKGYEKPLARLSPNEDTRSVLKPYGVFAVISPFNFPLALAAGMSSAALVAGNAVVLKPSEETPWSAQHLYEVLRDAGLPDGVFQLIHGTGRELGAALVRHPRVDGVVFTGSKQVGLEILHALPARYPKPCLLEMGGKNAAIVCAAAVPDKAIEGAYRSAFGLSGQKCSALSRLYVHRTHYKMVLDALVEKTKATKIGDPADADTFMGPVINRAAVSRYEHAVAEAKRDGRVFAGGEVLTHASGLEHGYFVAPTIVGVPRGHRLVKEELFLPFLAVEPFDTLDEALDLANDTDFGLTAGVFSEDPKEVEIFMQRMQAGVLYANRATGATTGAWPGVQAFCGWKGSGATGKGGCGPYYVEQFMREQSQTRMG